MEILEIMKNRHSVRQYKAKAIEESKRNGKYYLVVGDNGCMKGSWKKEFFRDLYIIPAIC